MGEDPEDLQDLHLTLRTCILFLMCVSAVCSCKAAWGPGVEEELTKMEMRRGREECHFTDRRHWDSPQ